MKDSSRKGQPKRTHSTFKGGLNCVGTNIRKIRISLVPKVTQTDLAARLQLQGINVNHSTIVKIEKRTRVVRDFEALAIAKALRVPIEKLYSF